MKKILALFLALALTAFAFVACDTEGESDIPDDPFGLSVSVTDVTADGCTLVFTRTGENDTVLSTTVGYRLEKDFYGLWEPVKNTLAEGEIVEFSQERIDLPAGESVSFEIDWTEYYGTLSAGTYRISKGVTAYEEGVAVGAFSYSATFTVEEE